MIGNWAGELGPTQFTPADYFKHGIDFDGDGRVDMIHSVPDALASAANLLKSFGWQTRPALAAGGSRAGADALGAIRARHAASALAVGEMGRHRGARRPVASRQSAGLADPADGPPRAGVPRLSELQGLHRMERRASSTRPPRPISAPVSPARRRSGPATASRWCRPRRRSRSCNGC